MSEAQLMVIEELQAKRMEPVILLDEPPCEWSWNDRKEFWATQCGMVYEQKYRQLDQMKDFAFCPYCGKAIKMEAKG